MFTRINTQEELAKHLHATCFSPIKLTLIKDVRFGNFATWPGLTSELIPAHLPKLEATIFRSFDQTIKTSDKQKVRNYY